MIYTPLGSVVKMTDDDDDDDEFYYEPIVCVRARDP